MAFWDQDAVVDQAPSSGGGWNQDPVVSQGASSGGWHQDPVVDPDEEERRRRQPAPESEGMFATGLRSFAHEAPAVAAGAAGAMTGAGLGSAVAPGVGTVVGGLAGAVAGGFGGSAVAETGLKALGYDDSMQRAVNEKTNPWSSAIGSGLAQVLGFGAGAASTAARVGGAAIGGGIEAGSQLYQGEFDPAKLATQTAAGAAFTNPYKWGTRLEQAGQRAGEEIGAGYRARGAEKIVPEQHGSAGSKSDSYGSETATPPRKDADVGDAHQERSVGSERNYPNPTEPEIAANRPGINTTGRDPDIELAIKAKAGPEPPPTNVPVAEPPQGRPMGEEPTAAPEAPGPVDQATMGRAADEQVAANQAATGTTEPIGREPTTVRADDPSVIPEAAIQRDVVERGRLSGRPIQTEPLPIGTEQQILERGAQRVEEGPRPGEVPPPEMQAARRQGAPAELPEGFTVRQTPGGRHILEQDGGFRGDFPTAAAAITDANRMAQLTTRAPPSAGALKGERLTQAALEARTLNVKEAGAALPPIGAETPLDTKVAEALTAPKPTRGEALKARQAAKAAAVKPAEVTPPVAGTPAVANVPPATPAANQGQAAAKAALVGAGGPPPPPKGPTPPPPPPPGPPPPRHQLVQQGKLGDADAMKAAFNADNELHKLSTMPAGEQYPLKDLTREAASIHPEIKGKGDQQVYEAIERGTFDKLPSKLQDAYNHVATYLDKKIDDIKQDLVDRKKIEKIPDDPNYVHRMVKNVPERVVDPINEGSLPGIVNPSALHERAFHGAEAKDGTRLVLSGSGESVSVMKDRQVEGKIKRPGIEEPLKNGDIFTYKGKQYTVDGGITSEIEQHATHADGSPVEYHKSAVASKIAEYRELKMRQDYFNLIDKFKGKDSPLWPYMTRDFKEAEKRGWKESEVPDFKGLYMHPNLEQVMHNNYNPGLGATLPQLDALRAINQFAVRSIFWNPVPHSMNALMHYVVGRGGDWFPTSHPVETYRNFAKSIKEGFEAAYTQNGLLQDMNRQGASLVMSKIDSQKLIPAIGDILGTDLRNNPGKWDAYARQYGLGKGVDAVKLWYDGAQRALWTFSDGLMASRIRELEMGGMSRADAIASARVHMPDYRLPIEFLGSKALVRAMSDNRISIFGRYHMGMLNSLSHMTQHLLGPNASAAERKEAFGNVLALTVMATVMKPALDKMVQLVTGNEKAEVQPRGPLGPITHTIESLQGKKDVGQTLSNIFTFSPAVKQITQTLANRDFAGRKIVEPGSPLYKKAAQYTEYTAGNLVSPYSTFGPTVQPGSTKGNILHELLTQATDTKVPTEAQIKGKRYGELITKRDAAKREKKPRGLIEYLTP